MSRRSDRWQPSRRREKQMAGQLYEIFARFVEQLLDDASGPSSIAQRLLALPLDIDFQAWAEHKATQMVSMCEHDSQIAWGTLLRKTKPQQRQEAKQLQIPAPRSNGNILIGQELSRVLRSSSLVVRQQEEAAGMIKSVPFAVAKEVQKQAAEAVARGERPDQVEAWIRSQVPKITAKKVKTLARTEVAKTTQVVNRARAQAVGVQWYWWGAVGDQRTRRSHKFMDGVICRYDDAPHPERLCGEKDQGAYAPGGIWNCRCYAEPIIDSGDIPRWPARVYTGGVIVKMTRPQFEKLLL